jgi:hypothetical protein
MKNKQCILNDTAGGEVFCQEKRRRTDLRGAANSVPFQKSRLYGTGTVLALRAFEATEFAIANGQEL